MTQLKVVVEARLSTSFVSSGVCRAVQYREGVNTMATPATRKWTEVMLEELGLTWSNEISACFSQCFCVFLAV